MGQPCGKASWESLEGKTQIPRSTRREARHCCYSSEGNSTCMPPLETRTDSPGETPEVPQDPYHTGEESSGSGTDSTQVLRPRHRRERNPERPPNNSHGDGPFLRPQERVPEVPVVRREHLPQLENIQEVLPSRRDEAHFRSGISRLITPNLCNFQRVLHILVATQEVPRHSRLHSRGSTRVPATSRGAPYPSRSRE